MISNLALCAGLASFAFAAPTPSVNAFTSTDTACPTVYTTSTITYNTSLTSVSFTTTTATASTSVERVPSYNATVSVTRTFDDTSTIYITTGTSTVFVATATQSTEACTSTVTELAESTSTVYTGSWTSSSLTTYCPLSTTYEYDYPGTTSRVSTLTTTPVVHVTSYYPTTMTDYFAASTITTTLSQNSLVFVSGTTTETRDVVCTSTSYTCTASTTTTQAAKCAPTNLYSGIAGVGFPEHQTAKTYPTNSTNVAIKDASSCCQACAEDATCAAEYWYAPGSCTLVYNPEPECGMGFDVEYDGFRGPEDGYIAQVGCGYIAAP